MGDGLGIVTVRLPQSLAEHANGSREIAIDVEGTVPLSYVLEHLQEQAPAIARRVQDETGAIRRFVNVYVGDDESRTLDGLRTLVPPGTVVMVIPSVAGGQ